MYVPVQTCCKRMQTIANETRGTVPYLILILILKWPLTTWLTSQSSQAYVLTTANVPTPNPTSLLIPVTSIIGSQVREPCFNYLTQGGEGAIPTYP